MALMTIFLQKIIIHLKDHNFFSFKSKDYKWMTSGFNTHIYSSLLNDQYIYIIWNTCYECPYLMKLIHCFKSV